ncbi:MAG: iron-containing alcohol dehydrogenase [Reyranellaceae bacterium]
MALINYNTKVQFDFGAVALLAQEMALAGARRPLIVTDKGVAAAGLVERVRAALPQDMPVSVFDAMPANPTERAATAACAAYRAQGCDSIIGLGGGSAMDGAKAAAILAANDGPLERYAFYNVGMNFPPRLPAPTFVVPTTAGTGSEVARSAVLIFDSGRKSLLFVTPGTVRCAILDPELTLGLPPSITAATGMDAIAHCLETFCSPRVNPPADAIALDGLKRAAANIEIAVRDGANREARWQMMMAAMEGALAFQKGMGAVHALSHPLGVLHLHHGTLNAVLIPPVLRYNADHLTEKMATLRAVLGLPANADVPDWFGRLNERLKLPASLRAMNVPKQRFEEFAAEAMTDSSHPSNPRPMTPADYRAVLQAAF